MKECQDQHGSVAAASMVNLGILLILMRIAGFIRVPWLIIVAPLIFVAAAAVAVVVLVVIALVVAWLIDEVNGAAEKMRRIPGKERDIDP